MDNIVIQMIILLLLVVAGFVSNRCGLMGGDFDRKLSGFIINVSCPCLIISSVMGDVFPDRGMILPLLGVGMITYVLLFLIAYFLPRYFVRKADYRGIYSFMLMFANVGFIGYPVVVINFLAARPYSMPVCSTYPTHFSSLLSVCRLSLGST